MSADADENLFNPSVRAGRVAPASAPPRPANSRPIYKSVSAPEPTPSSSSETHDRLEMLRDVELDVRIELGRTRLRVEDVLNLSEGSVVEMDRLAGEPVEVFVSDRLVARGEVMVHGDRLCVRVNEILGNPGEKR
jgi:flagellar motor switch protein FliN/FliY